MDIIFVIMCIVALVVGEQQGDNTGDVFLLYADVKKGTVGTMTVDGSQSEHCLPSGTFIFPRGITYDQNSKTVYVLDNFVNVYKFTLDGQSTPELIYQDTSANLYALALDGEGHIFITDAKKIKITRIYENGTDPVDWVAGVSLSMGILVDTTDRHLIRSDYHAHTISRTSLDDPLSTVTVIIQNTINPTALHIDTQLGKLFWCEYNGRVLMANTDGSDVEIILDIAKSYPQSITGYGGHRYVSDDSSPFTVYDIYNGSYTEIFNSKTSRPFSITVVSGQSAAKACHVNCYNGGSSVNRTCDCVHPWTGQECNDCGITCSNGGSIDKSTCICKCRQYWLGDQCDVCNITCENGATLDVNTCTCDCLSQWRGDRCEDCDITCQNGGTLDADTCICDCSPHWSGDQCEDERTTRKHLTTEVTTDRLVETTGQSFETLETRNPFFEPSVMWPIIGAAVLIVLIIAVTVIVVTVLRHKRANSERVAGTPAQQVDNELKDISGKSPTNETHDSESRDIEHQYQAIGDTNDLQNTVTRKTEYENTGIYEDTMANTCEKPDPAGREQYVNTAVYQSLDEY